MSDPYKRLLAISSPPISPAPPLAEALGAYAKRPVGAELLLLLSARNGFYAFESALHVRSTADAPPELGLEAWNNTAQWINCYDGLADDLFFFAEDVFGVQFCTDGNVIFTFDPETGATEEFSTSLSQWCDSLLDDFRLATGQPLAHEWQRLNGQLPKGCRLVAKVPFVLGGAYEVTNLYALNTADSLRWRATIAQQIRGLPDGAQLRLSVE